MKAKKTWVEKLNNDKDLPKVVAIPPRMQKNWGKGTLVIPKPREVRDVILRVPRRKLITIPQIAKRLAKQHDATIGCPITVGIFAWIAAYAAEEEEQAGKKRVAPYWRVIKAGGELNPRYPGGIANLRKRLQAEGHTIITKGKRLLVQDYEKYLVKE